MCACDYGKPVVYAAVSAKGLGCCGPTPEIFDSGGATLVVGRPVTIRDAARRWRFDMDKKAKTPKKPKQPKTGADKKK